MVACSQCAATLDTPLACSACGALCEAAPDATPWALFGLPLTYQVDPKDLLRSLRRISRLVHPDFHGTSGDPQRERAERNTARLNEAYDVLRADYARADALVRLLGGPDEKAERQMPQSFLMEVLEWNETLEEARDKPSDARAALGRLAEELTARRASALGELNEHLRELPAASAPALTDVRKALNALRYLDRTLNDIKELQLEQAAR